MVYADDLPATVYALGRGVLERESMLGRHGGKVMTDRIHNAREVGWASRGHHSELIRIRIQVKELINARR